MAEQLSQAMIEAGADVLDAHVVHLAHGGDREGVVKAVYEAMIGAIGKKAKPKPKPAPVAEPSVDDPPPSSED